MQAITSIPRIIDDTRLSWAARGMLAYLLSRPAHWEVRVTDLQRGGNMGRGGGWRRGIESGLAGGEA